MSTYTPEEINAIVSAPMQVGMAVALVDMGVISTAIEAAAMTRTIAGAAKKYPGNSIIQTAFADEALKDLKFERPDVKPEEIKSGAYVEAAIAEAHQVLAMLRDRATEAEIMEYKQFIYDCGEAVAKAAGSGLFGTGAKVSESEAQTLDRLKAALAL